MKYANLTVAAPDAIVPVPLIVSRRAWEAAFDLSQEHSAVIGNEATWNWLQSVAVYRDPDLLTWAEAAALFRLHRQFRRVRI